MTCRIGNPNRAGFLRPDFSGGFRPTFFSFHLQINLKLRASLHFLYSKKSATVDKSSRQMKKAAQGKAAN